MAELQPLLVFDTTAILATQAKQWQEWVDFGICVLPRAVNSELDFLTQRATEASDERIARDFFQFNRDKAFAILDATALVKGIEAEATSLSKRSRLVQAIAECSYALSKQYSSSLVVLVSNDRPLVQRIQNLQVANLCAVAVAELLQWSRHQKHPATVDQALQRMPELPLPPVLQPEEPTHTSPLSLTDVPRTVPIKRAAVSGARLSRAEPSITQKVINTVQLLIALVLFTSAGLVAWRTVDPEGSQGFWDRFKLPDIPTFDIDLTNPTSSP